ncbi:unnamed protein product, partial [Rotaria sordida]
KKRHLMLVTIQKHPPKPPPLQQVGPPPKFAFAQQFISVKIVYVGGERLFQ